MCEWLVLILLLSFFFFSVSALIRVQCYIIRYYAQMKVVVCCLDGENCKKHCKNKVVGFNPHKVTSVAAPVYQRMLSYSCAVQ